MNKIKEERTIIYPAIYKHFKYEIQPDKYIYATMGIAEKVDWKMYIGFYNTSCEDEIFAYHTETKEKISVVKLGKDYYYKETDGVKNEKLVLYKSLYDDSGIYARPLEMFLSKVDKEKYPDIQQIYRFELIRY
jgi:hypothetical protein